MNRDVSTPILIRPMQEDDLEAIYALEIKIFPSPWSLENYRHEVQSEVSYCWVALIDREIVGFIVAWLLVDEIHIANIAVAEAQRRKGIGAKLICKAFQTLIEEGAIGATLEVRASNLSAQVLYRQFGFEAVGERRKYYQDNKEDALIMSATSLKQASLACE